MNDIWIHPSLILIAGAALLPLFKGIPRRTWLMLVPVLAFIDVWQFSHAGMWGSVQFLDWQLVFGRIDRLSQVFAYIMTLMCIVGT
ncbi:MAG: Na+/H+ antiporter subunit D, partial [Desulfobacteraceae bacterium]|nr:Na+/H+ antiporter subunit D [Desulfobacteraceae bacterium]